MEGKNKNEEPNKVKAMFENGRINYEAMAIETKRIISETYSDIENSFEIPNDEKRIFKRPK